MWGDLCLSRASLAITYRQRIPYGVKQVRRKVPLRVEPTPAKAQSSAQTEAYKKAKQQVRAAARNARKMKESKGILVEGRKSLYMSLQQNTGISWYRSLQVLKHLETHWRANPPMSNKLKEKIAAVAEVVKQGR